MLVRLLILPLQLQDRIGNMFNALLGLIQLLLKLLKVTAGTGYVLLRLTCLLSACLLSTGMLAAPVAALITIQTLAAMVTLPLWVTFARL